MPICPAPHNAIIFKLFTSLSNNALPLGNKRIRDSYSFLYIDKLQYVSIYVPYMYLYNNIRHTKHFKRADKNVFQEVYRS